MRFESLEKDKVDIEGCKFVQLKMRVQTDGSNCGIYCLKVCSYIIIIIIIIIIIWFYNTG